jgi:hypothetical protein
LDDRYRSGSEYILKEFILRGYDCGNERTTGATICEAVLATFASNRLFDWVPLSKHMFGEPYQKDFEHVLILNPVYMMKVEAERIWRREEERGLEPLMRSFISIGIGHLFKTLRHSKTTGPGWFLYVRLSNTAQMEEYMSKYFSRWWDAGNRSGKYFRFDVDDGLEDIGIREWDHDTTIKEVTEKYLTDPTKIPEVEACVQKLQLKQDITMSSSQVVEKVPYAQKTVATGETLEPDQPVQSRESAGKVVDDSPDQGLALSPWVREA